MVKYNVMAYYGKSAMRRGSWADYQASSPKKAILKAKEEARKRGFTMQKGTHGWKAVRVSPRKRSFGWNWI